MGAPTRPDRNEPVGRSQAEPFSSFLSAALFPGRTSLYAHEVAKALRVSARHIVNLIVEGEIGARDIGSGKVTSQGRYRVGVDALDDFIRRRASSELLKRRATGKATKCDGKVLSHATR